MRDILYSLKYPFALAAHHLYYARPLIAFEPKVKQQAPYWQDILFGEGRLEKLLERLKKHPHVGNYRQKNLLSESEGGTHGLPGNTELIKYELNDTMFLIMALAASHQISRVADIKEIKDLKGFKLNDDGVCFPENHEHFKTRDVTQWRKPGTPGFHVLVSKDEIVHNVILCTDHAVRRPLANDIYDWLIKDVAPFVPAIFIGFNIVSGKDGILFLEPTNNFVANNFNRLLTGYKGSLPERSKQQSAAFNPA